MRRCVFLLVLFLALPSFAASTTVSFDAFLPGPNQSLDNSSLSVDAATFVNTYYESWGAWYWAGFAFSTVSNTTANSYTNQFAPAEALPRACAIGYNDSWHDAPTILFDLPAAPRRKEGRI